MLKITNIVDSFTIFAYDSNCRMKFGAFVLVVAKMFCHKSNF
jgi:hypothetical protein